MDGILKSISHFFCFPYGGGESQSVKPVKNSPHSKSESEKKSEKEIDSIIYQIGRERLLS